MSLFVSQWLVYSGLVFSLVLLGVGYWFVFRQQQRLKTLEQNLASLKTNLEMSSDSGIGVGRKVLSMERRLHATEQKQQEIESADLEKVSYNEAVRLLSLGANVDDLTGSCGLTRAEANLLKVLHASQPKMQTKNR